MSVVSKSVWYYLLDTHICLRALACYKKTSQNTQALLNQIKDGGIEIIPIKDEHIITYSTFDFHKTHRDPFDRYLIATAYFEKKAIITRDEKFNLYSDKINIVW